MSLYTNQEAINKGRKTFVVEKRERCVSTSGCAYYDPGRPHGCAIGALMSEKARMRAAELDLEGVDDDAVTLFQLEPRLRGLSFEFMEDLQRWHDARRNWDSADIINERGIEALDKLERIYCKAEVSV